MIIYYVLCFPFFQKKDFNFLGETYGFPYDPIPFCFEYPVLNK